MPLVVQSLARHATGGVPFTVTPEAQAMLQTYSWPGNVRELENVVQRAVVLSGGRTITPAHLMFDETATEHMQAAPVVSTPAASVSAQMQNAFQAMTTATPAAAHAAPSVPAMPVAISPVGFDVAPAANLEDAVKSSELQVIMAAIQSTASRMEAAAKLGISPRTLRYKLAQFRQRGLAEGASA